MLPTYSDIKSRLGEPIWYDAHGVPRYDPFTPRMCGVYDDYVAYMEIRCQSCGLPFRVAVGISVLGMIVAGHVKRKEDVRLPSPESIGHFHYGDPPRHGCVGDTMNSVPVQVLEFWEHDITAGWRRLTQHEGPVREDWAKDLYEQWGLQ